MGQILKGNDLMLFVDTGSGMKSIAFATSHTLGINAETANTSTKDSSGKWSAKQITRCSWNMSTENLYSLNGEGAEYDDLFTLMTTAEEIDVVFALESGYANKADQVPAGGWQPISSPKYSGKAVITSLELNAPNDQGASYKATFEGVGALVKQ